MKNCKIQFYNLYFIFNFTAIHKQISVLKKTNAGMYSGLITEYNASKQLMKWASTTQHYNYSDIIKTIIDYTRYMICQIMFNVYYTCNSLLLAINPWYYSKNIGQAVLEL